ncbi:MAG: alpha beta-hydrolase [Lasallia pustulata]|uniref:Alpha beta-hydrolase n=1 Tax=Lasallia pustulata TaxID=136370 RepID=A0A5M8Q304_9LECA|nr:MAG: alpha beta-hydrolase [Lasallia pustulata]
MALLVFRTGSRCFHNLPATIAIACRRYKSDGSNVSSGDLPGPFGHAIKDEYAKIRDNYQTPKNPIVLAHGLFGFDQLHLAGSIFPGLHYWRGITAALEANGIEVITASVPASGSIEKRAKKLSEDIEKKAGGKSVNILAHSMNSGLDSRYMISRLKPPNVKVLSLTTIASPHRGSAFADYMFDTIGPDRLPKIYKVLEFIHMETGAFSQLTRKYMREDFNPRTPDREGVRYFSYGATFEPSLWSSFRHSHRIVEREEGPNDGLVSVESSKWGGEDGYKGTLIDVSHLDLINWTSRLRWYFWELTGNKRNFNAIAFYLDIGDMLAKEGY